MKKLTKKDLFSTLHFLRDYKVFPLSHLVNPDSTTNRDWRGLRLINVEIDIARNLVDASSMRFQVSSALFMHLNQTVMTDMYLQLINTAPFDTTRFGYLPNYLFNAGILSLTPRQIIRLVHENMCRPDIAAKLRVRTLYKWKSIVKNYSPALQAPPPDIVLKNLLSLKFPYNPYWRKLRHYKKTS